MLIIYFNCRSLLNLATWLFNIITCKFLPNKIETDKDHMAPERHLLSDKLCHKHSISADASVSTAGPDYDKTKILSYVVVKQSWYINFINKRISIDRILYTSLVLKNQLTPVFMRISTVYIFIVYESPLSISIRIYYNMFSGK